MKTYLYESETKLVQILLQNFMHKGGTPPEHVLGSAFSIGHSLLTRLSAAREASKAVVTDGSIVCTNYRPNNYLFPLPQRCNTCGELGHFKITRKNRLYTIPNPFMRWLYRRWHRTGQWLFTRYQNDAWAATDRP